MKRPNLGNHVSAEAIVKKVREGKHTGTFDTLYKRMPQMISGFYIGYRTVYEGHTDRVDDYGEYELAGHYSEYKRGKSLEVWLVVIDPRKNPVLVSPEDCIW